MLLSRGVAPRMGASLAKMTRVWRVDTCSDGVEADLLGVQQLLQVGPNVLPRYLTDSSLTKGLNFPSSGATARRRPLLLSDWSAEKLATKQI